MSADIVGSAQFDEHIGYTCNMLVKKEEGDHDDHEGHKEEVHIFPLPYCFFFGGFFMMLFLDQVAFHSIKQQATNGADNTNSQG